MRRQFYTSWWKLSHYTADAMCECVCHLLLFLTTAAVRVRDFVLCEVFVAWHCLLWMQSFFFFYHCLKATSLNSMGGHHIFTNVHSSIMSCPYNAGFFLRTVSTLWLRRRFLLCISVFRHRRWSFSRWSQRAVSNHPSYWWTCFLMGLVLPRTICLHSIQKQG